MALVGHAKAIVEQLNAGLAEVPVSVPMKSEWRDGIAAKSAKSRALFLELSNDRSSPMNYYCALGQIPAVCCEHCHPPRRLIRRRRPQTSTYPDARSRPASFADPGILDKLIPRDAIIMNEGSDTMDIGPWPPVRPRSACHYTCGSARARQGR